MTLIENQANINYVLFHTRNKEKNKHFFKINGIVRIMSNEEAKINGYYQVQKDVKRFICIEIEINNELQSSNLNPSVDNIPFNGSLERYDSQYTTIDVLENKE